ncbi:MAG: hypothetical protein IT386_16185 [Deltaproteobacteria bacterium]|nr:hypothetical protein [Deltaproteobacteria bacterium]
MLSLRIRRKILIACLAGLGLAAGRAVAEETPASTGSADPGKASLTEVNKQLTNPVSSLWSITFQQNNFLLHPGSGRGLRYSGNLILQPVLPVSITNEWNLITRPVLPLFVTQPHPEEGDPWEIDSTTGFGDITLLQLVSPSENLVGNWLLGLGPSWIFPAASSRYTGQGKWQVGPSAIVGYLSDKWIFGALVQNWISYGGSGPADTNSMNLQPIASYFLPDGWSVGYSGNVLANWEGSGRNTWTVPLGLALAKVVKVGPLPVRIALGAQYMLAYPEDYGQRWNLQLTLAPVVPKLIRGNLAQPRQLEFGLPPRRP